LLARRSFALGVLAASAFLPGEARAQTGDGAQFPMQAPPPGASTWSPAAPPPTYVANPYAGGAARPASDAEVGTLYAVSVGYGVGTGIWLDAVLGVDDPGLQFLPPVILGVAAPVGVFFLNRPRMARGMPAAIATGTFIGTAEAIGISTYQFVTASPGNEIGFKGFSTAVFLGSTGGAAAGYLTAVSMEPSPRTSLLLASSAVWGTIVGSMFGYGSSTAFSDWSTANDSAALGGLVGLNIGVAGSLALSTTWIPTYDSLSWMWIGFGAGVAVSLPVYLFYAGGDHDARRGLIFQGTAATLGLVAGAVFTLDSKPLESGDIRAPHARQGPSERAPQASGFEITGAGLLPVRSGFGVQLTGIIF
jgi:hypothetical protein